MAKYKKRCRLIFVWYLFFRSKRPELLNRPHNAFGENVEGYARLSCVWDSKSDEYEEATASVSTCSKYQHVGSQSNGNLPLNLPYLYLVQYSNHQLKILIVWASSWMDTSSALLTNICTWPIQRSGHFLPNLSNQITLNKLHTVALVIYQQYYLCSPAWEQQKRRPRSEVIHRLESTSLRPLQTNQ